MVYKVVLMCLVMFVKEIIVLFIENKLEEENFDENLFFAIKLNPWSVALPRNFLSVFCTNRKNLSTQRHYELWFIFVRWNFHVLAHQVNKLSPITIHLISYFVCKLKLTLSSVQTSHNQLNNQCNNHEKNLILFWLTVVIVKRIFFPH